MALIDEVVISVEAGSGGDGCISFRREKYVPRGGPNGGNGGTGGSVYLRATHNKTTLLDFKFRPLYDAERGEHGMGKDMDGRGGEDLIIDVPVGTLVYDNVDNFLLADLKENEQLALVARGGKGGRGNTTFASSTRRAPRIATPGAKGEQKELKLELRLMADVGLVGLPNAGKSSFLRVISRAHPKVADYPFTTLEPHLGVVDHKHRQFVVADLPGLIEGASDGAGLGHKFLRHATRNRVLLHLVEIAQPVSMIKRHIQTIRKELEKFDTSLLDREVFLVFTKADTLSAVSLQRKLSALKKAGLSGYAISSHSGVGIATLLDAVAERLSRVQLSTQLRPQTPTHSLYQAEA